MEFWVYLNFHYCSLFYGAYHNPPTVYSPLPSHAYVVLFYSFCVGVSVLFISNTNTVRTCPYCVERLENGIIRELWSVSSIVVCVFVRWGWERPFLYRGLSDRGFYVVLLPHHILFDWQPRCLFALPNIFLLYVSTKPFSPKKSKLPSATTLILAKHDPNLKYDFWLSRLISLE